MANKDFVNQGLRQLGYDPTARVADYRNPAAYRPPSAGPTPKSDFAANVGKSLAGAAGFVGNATLNTTKSFGAGAIAFGKEGMRNVNMLAAGQKMNQTAAQAKALQEQFKAGKISAAKFQKEYTRLLAENKAAVKQRDSQKKSTKKVLQDLTVGNLETAANVAATVAGGGGLANAAKASGLKGFAARTIDMGASKNVVSALVKGQLTKSSAMSLPQTAGKVAKGDYVGAGVDTALLLSGGIKGGPIGAVGTGLNKVGKVVSKNIYDTHGLYDVVKLKGGKTINEVMGELGQVNPSLAKKSEKILKVFQDHATQKHGLGPESVAKAIEAYQPTGKQFKDMTFTEFLQAAQSIIKDKRTLQAAAKKAGLKIPDGYGVVAARLTPESKATIAKRLSEADDPLAELTKMKKEKLVVGPNLPGQIEDMVKSGATGTQLAKKINSLKSVQPQLIDGKMVTTKDGRFLALAKGAETVKRPNEVADIVKGEKARFGFIGRALEKAGVGTRESNPAEQKAIFNKVKDNFIKSVDNNADIKMSGRELLSGLNKLTDQKKGVFDIRQLQKGEIAELLGGDKKQAKAVLDAYNDAFKGLSIKERGLAGKVTDWNMRNNPLAPGYSRIQSAARYEMNPFFRLQENVETRLGAAALTGKNTMPFTDRYNDTVKLLRDEGVFKNMFAGPAGEGAAGLGAISAKLSKSQQNQIAMTLETLAGDKKNIMKFISDPKNADIMQDIKTIVQYPDKGFTSSNLMKAMNLVVFPMRYNLKVTQFAAKALARQPGAVQAQVLRGLKDFADWQRTPEGIKWNSDNAEALGILRYFTPVGSIETVAKLLSPGSVRGIKDFGTIGGLPFGVISNVLQGQGVTQSPTPYLNPKTGEVVPTKIPKDVKARAEQALSDIVGTLFTYPGRIINAPSKSDISKGIVGVATFGKLKGGEYESVTRTDLTPQQKKQQAVLQAGQKSSTPQLPLVMKNRSADLSSKKPVDIKPIYKPTRAKRAKAKASRPGTWRP